MVRTALALIFLEYVCLNELSYKVMSNNAKLEVSHFYDF
jgi:hypothetical protein